MLRCLAIVLALIVALGASSGAPAEDYLLPVVAHQVPGHDGNRWSSELYLVNDGREGVTVTLGALLPGRRQPVEPCATFAPVTRTVPPHRTVLWSAAELGPDIGCATLALGGLLLGSTAPITVTSRMVNHRAGKLEPSLPAHGTGQYVVATPLDELPGAGAYLLPGLVWHRNACGPAEFATNVGFTNPGDGPVRLTLDLPPELAALGMRIDGQPVALPHTIEVPGGSWRQVRVSPEPSMLTVCMDPELFDLWIDSDGPIAIYGSVIDREVEDPRTVVPIARR